MNKEQTIEAIREKCKIDICNKISYEKGFCAKHYYHMHKYGYTIEQRIINNLDEEVWTDIKDFQGLYKISNYGRILSLRVKKIIKNSLCNGYEKISLHKNKKLYTFLIHRLVALHFIQNINNKKTINHKDGNKINNHASNLEWVSYSENHIHAYSILNRKINKTNSGNFGKNTFGKKTKIKQVSKETGMILNVFDTIRNASQKTGISESHISNVVNGIKNISGNFSFYKYE